ncbi:DUF3899 domain-containing protein [Paenibacillus apiarius]|uniref:DUF3899 domain-containing protein n=1 Tax=Paenibacillus apiarius TaxID=46240 RepID=A0ABT4DZW9_9BACL|nr:DUF3899 domain-containing protein [Paenibacillus apiarius]MCY9515110.1 DUF3899 domain-containing protein [Paenibacillus apiarius]MCY9522904.1 DUF3899 domain-containing protein [Paenibacillus apiarius]MCY9553707.1 DUF3899 domain-containing protein [Paenibacillus apiarius]MCY9556460.1 DUF3899 domain-containing protein [Paenibacillus apiarius]MCY9684894.1 DUF3899 domain-containing protein [Paenibacillus apiarius]
MKRLLLITVLFTVAYTVYNSHAPIIVNLSNSFFICGLIYLFIALFSYVRNIGFFKTLSYHLYRKRQADKHNDVLNAAGATPEQHRQKKIALHEYTAHLGQNKWSNKCFYLFSIPLLLCSCVLAFASM